MRLCSFNVQNFFNRAVALNQEDLSITKKALSLFKEFNEIIQKPVYSKADKKKLLKCIEELNLNSKGESKYFILRKTRGQLIKKPKNKPPEIVAAGRDSWIGWLELKTGPVNEIATHMTAKVIKDVNADILSIIEIENRVALKNFNSQYLKPNNSDYSHIMLIDGNDDRGIDVGIMTKADLSIESIISHVDEKTNGEFLFSRDCPEYQVRINDNASILILVNHLKSKMGDPETSDAKRKSQAKRVREIYELRKSQGHKFIAIMGDFNDIPKSDPLSPLFKDGSDLKDISSHPKFDDGGRPGTIGNCEEKDKFDYILLSPALFDKVTAGGILRKGIWSRGRNQKPHFPHYDEITKPEHAASDHAAIWADIDIE